MNKKKKRIFDIIQIGQKGDRPSRLFDDILITVITLNIAVLFLETFDALSAFKTLFTVIEAVTLLFFLIEYALRIWTSEYLYPEVSKPKAVLRFIVSFDGLTLLLSIIPYAYFSGFVVLRMMRVVRILHLFRVNANYDSLHVITNVIVEKKTQILTSVFIIIVLMLSSSLCMYHAEHEAQPEVFNNALSGLWWSSATIFTIGYGDVYPITTAGRIMGVIINFLSLGAVAIPTGILSAGFVEQYTRMQNIQAAGEEQHGLCSATVTGDTSYLGRSVGDIEDSSAIDIFVLIRDGVSALPTRNIVLKDGDIIIYRNLVKEK
ncbi:MAG: ion transporter [Lachnospiraceae bacterium]|nr:ion transporter [Lachnospiraceae bacterium]